MQTAGRAARNVNGRVIMYADTITGSMQETIDETNRRRSKQLHYNEVHGITPTQIIKDISSSPLKHDDRPDIKELKQSLNCFHGIITVFFLSGTICMGKADLLKLCANFLA